MDKVELKYTHIMKTNYPQIPWSFDALGGFIWIDATPKPDFDALWTAIKQDVYLAEIRVERDALLDKTDKYIMSDYVHAKKADYKVYRKTLRDLPAKYKLLMIGDYEYKDKVVTKDGIETNLFPTI